jgi:hypothetical protein
LSRKTGLKPARRSFARVCARVSAFTTLRPRVAYATGVGYKRLVAYARNISHYTIRVWENGLLAGKRGERLARVVRTTKTVRGKRYRTYYVKIDLPEYIAERVEAYRVVIEEDTGRITLEPVYRREQQGRG